MDLYTRERRAGLTGSELSTGISVGSVGSVVGSGVSVGVGRSVEVGTSVGVGVGKASEKQGHVSLN